MSKPDQSEQHVDPPPGSQGGATGTHEPPPFKERLAPNAGKQLTVDVDGHRWARVPLQTELFARGDDLETRVTGYVTDGAAAVAASDELAPGLEQRWYVVVSEKIVAISQGRSYFTWEINPSKAARALSRFVVRTPHGLGLGTPWTMQLAIEEAGLPRIVVAAGVGALGKLVRQKGWFYRVAGHRVNAIDGPTEYSAYPSNVSAKLPPKDPEKVASALRKAIATALPAEVAKHFGGVVVIDSNDLGREILGQDTDLADDFFKKLFVDNPFGQGRQQTPIALALRLG
jgi:asparagine synthase (glutamine-hydrolysing)